MRRVYLYLRENCTRFQIRSQLQSYLSFKQIQAKYLKGRTIIGVAAGRFHTVLWTREAVYTLGLNGGQLGKKSFMVISKHCSMILAQAFNGICLCTFLGHLLDPNGEKCVTTPRQVSALHHKDIAVSLVAASDGATVCVTTRGDIYLLADYQCKKMATKYVHFWEGACHSKTRIQRSSCLPADSCMLCSVRRRNEGKLRMLSLMMLVLDKDPKFCLHIIT